MKKENIALLLLILSLVMSAGFVTKEYRIKGKPILRSADLRKGNYVSHEVQITFTGYCSLYGTSKDCGIFTPGTVVLKGTLSGDENVGRYDPVSYTGVLNLSINMAICSVKRENDEDKFCTMTVIGSGSVKTELEIDTAAGYGYIKIEHVPSLGAFNVSVNGTCDPPQMIDEQKNVPNNSIAAVFNGLELRSLKNSPRLRPGTTYTEPGADSKTVIVVK